MAYSGRCTITTSEWCRLRRGTRPGTSWTLIYTLSFFKAQAKLVQYFLVCNSSSHLAANCPASAARRKGYLHPTTPSDRSASSSTHVEGLQRHPLHQGVLLHPKTSQIKLRSAVMAGSYTDQELASQSYTVHTYPLPSTSLSCHIYVHCRISCYSYAWSHHHGFTVCPRHQVH